MQNNMKEVIKSASKELKIAAVSLVVGLLVTLAFIGYSNYIQGGISKKFIRFHVLANSDSNADQALKIKVKEGVLDYLKRDLVGFESIEETRAFLTSEIPHIKEVSEDIITQSGYDYGVHVSLADAVFPTKQYGDVVLVAGNYEALRIEIGDSAGKNWWCAIYPPLCYVDVAGGNVSDSAKARLQSDLTPTEYEFVIDDTASKPSVKFKVVELWQERKFAKAQKRAVSKK